MPRERSKNKHLPARMYQKSGSYYFVDKQNKWHNLGRSYSEALKLYADMAITRPQKISSMRQIFDRFEFDVLPNNYPESTATKYRQHIKLLRRAFQEMAPTDVKPMHIRQYLDARGKNTPVSANREVATMSAIMKQARNWGVIEHNPCLKIGRLPEKPRERYVTNEEWNKVYPLAPDILQIAMDLADITGLRRGNIIGLQRKDWGPDGLYVELIKQRKNAPTKRMMFARTPELEQVIDRALSHRPVASMFILCQHNGQPYTSDGMNSMWQRFMVKAQATGVERFTFHDLRGRSASDAESDEEAAKRLGNSVNVVRRHYRRKAVVVQPLRRKS